MARILGLDIGTTAVRGTVLRTSLRKTEVERYVEAFRDPASDPQGRAESLRAAVRAVWASLGAPPDSVIAALGGEDASIRTAELPSAAAKRVAEVLPFELESVLPFPPEDAILDYQPIGTFDGKLRLLTCAATKARVGLALDELRDCGVSPAELSAGALALDGFAVFAPELRTGGPWMVLDVGYEHTDLAIFAAGKLVAARTVSFGTKHLPDRADAYARQLLQTLASHRAAGGELPLAVYMGGGGALAQGMPEWLAEKLGMEARLAQLPTPQAAQSQGADDATRALFLRSASLAAHAQGRGKRIDLRQGEFALKRTMGALRQQGVLLFGCAVAILVTFGFSTWSRYHVLDGQREALRAELGRVTRETFGEEITSAARARQLLEGRHVTPDPLPRFDAFDALDAINAAIPPPPPVAAPDEEPSDEGVRHDTRRLTIELGEGDADGRFELQGTVGNIAERDQIAAALAEVACFREIEPGPTTPANEANRINYKIEGVIQCVAPDAQAKNKNRRRRPGGDR